MLEENHHVAHVISDLHPLRWRWLVDGLRLGAIRSSLPVLQFRVLGTFFHAHAWIFCTNTHS